MHGSLANTSASDVLRELRGEGGTGTLLIAGADASGSISLVDGHIVGATSPTPGARLGDRLVGSGYLEPDALAEALRVQRAGGESARLGAILVENEMVPQHVIRLFLQEQTLDALLDLFRWRVGTFEFRGGRPVELPEVALRLQVDDALIEVARRYEEWDELSKIIPDLDAVPNFRDVSQNTAAALEPDEFAVLASIDGERNVRELADGLGYGEFEAARIVYGLAMLGIVEIAPPADQRGTFVSSPEPDAGHVGDMAEDPGTAASPEEREIDERSDRSSNLSRVLAELRQLPSQSGPPQSGPSKAGPSKAGGAPSGRPAGQRPGRSPAGDHAPGQAAKGEPAGTSEIGEPGGGREPQPSSPPQPPGDVSELLRELSRLALGKDEPQARPADSRPDPGDRGTGDTGPPPAPPKRRSDPEDGKRRRRGLFGRG